MNSLTKKQPRRSREPRFKTCPDCGSQFVDFCGRFDAQKYKLVFVIMCLKCGFETKPFATKSKATSHWNNLE